MSAETGRTVDLERVRRDVDACIATQRSLSEDLQGVADGDVDPAAPSLLPGWSVAHVLTHIARNADSVLRMLDGLPQYWKGVDSRAADIELGSTRSWRELVDDVVSTSGAVEARMCEVTGWSGTVPTVFAVRPKSFLPIARRREVEIHRIDLGLGYGFADLPTDYVRTDLALMTMLWTSRQPMGMTTLPDAVLRLAEHDRLAWLFGRITVDGAEPAGVF